MLFVEMSVEFANTVGNVSGLRKTTMCGNVSAIVNTGVNVSGLRKTTMCGNVIGITKVQMCGNVSWIAKGV